MQIDSEKSRSYLIEKWLTRSSFEYGKSWQLGKVWVTPSAFSPSCGAKTGKNVFSMFTMKIRAIGNQRPRKHRKTLFARPVAADTRTLGLGVIVRLWPEMAAVSGDFGWDQSGVKSS
jgi:hypothetical protein